MKPTLAQLSSCALLLPAMITPLAAQEAEDAPETAAQDFAEIASDTLSGNSGRVAINIAAGDANQQVGTAIIALGDTAITAQSAEQIMDAAQSADRATSITIGAGALSNNSGLVSLNLTAGTQNQSANLAALTIGYSGVVSDQMLAQSSAPSDPASSPAQAPPTSNDRIAIDDAAFAGNNGLVQMNVVGGERNSSANTFALNVSAGGQP